MRKTIWLEFGFLALLIMGPLLLPGYIQTLDMTWGPHLNVPDPSHNTWLFYSVIKFLSAIISSQVTQKLFLAGLFVLAGVGAYRLAAERPATGRAGSYLAGIFYLFNPFVYTRFIEGQYLVLAGYALLPWAAAAVWRLVTAPSWRHAWRAAAWFVAIALVSLHTVGFMLLVGLVMVVVGWRHSRRLWTWLGVGGALALVLGALTLAPLLLGQSSAARAIKTFDLGQYQAFASITDVSNVPISTLLLGGFWNNTSGTYTVPAHFGSWWLVVAGLLGALLVVGGINIWQRRDRLGYALIIAGLIAWWLAMGVGWSWSAPTTHWLVEHLPFYRGYREPGKWLAVLALGYAYVAARGVGQLELWWAKRPRLSLAAVGTALIVPLLLTPTMLWAAGGQLRSADYPADWYAAKQAMTADHTAGSLIVLPWHAYLPITFIGRPVANPAANFFTRAVITSDDPELAGVTPENQSPNSPVVKRWLVQQAGTAATMAYLDARYVVVMKEFDWRNYDWLTLDPDVQLVSDSPTLRVYRLKGAN